jgi:hypothetical protein
MKALPQPSLLMLWIGRIFAAYVLLHGLVDFQFYYFSSDDALRSTVPSAGSIAPFRTAALHAASIELLGGSILFFSLFLLRNIIARFCLGLTASMGFVMLSYHFVRRLYILFHLPPVYEFVVHGLRQAELFQLGALLMQFMLIWISLRPPQSSKTSGHHSSDHPLPQSF